MPRKRQKRPFEAKNDHFTLKMSKNRQKRPKMPFWTQKRHFGVKSAKTAKNGLKTLFYTPKWQFSPVEALNRLKSPYTPQNG